MRTAPLTERMERPGDLAWSEGSSGAPTRPAALARPTGLVGVDGLARPAGLAGVDGLVQSGALARPAGLVAVDGLVCAEADGASGDPVLLVAHGSRDPRAAAATRALAQAVAVARPGTPVLASWLDHTEPDPIAALRELAAAGHTRATLVPLLLTAAYHRRVDIPAAVAAARRSVPAIQVGITDVLGPVGAEVDQPLLAALRRRLAEAEPGRFDALVLAAAGTRDPAARASVGRVAQALGAALGTPTRVSYASAAPPAVGAAVRRLRARGARRVAVAAYFLAPGLFHDAVTAAAQAAGAVAVSAPLTDAPELVNLILHRIQTPHPHPLPFVDHEVGGGL